LESNWRWNVYDQYGVATGFQLFARILSVPGFRWLLKESNTRATVRTNTTPGPDGFGTILQVLNLTPADRFPYGFNVVGD
jgi:hypothetical protein